MTPRQFHAFLLALAILLLSLHHSCNGDEVSDESDQECPAPSLDATALSGDEINKSKARPFGDAKWIADVGRSYSNQTSLLLGRPERVFVNSKCLVMPFRDRVLERKLDSGELIAASSPLGATVDQLACAKHRIGITFKPPGVLGARIEFLVINNLAGEGMRRLGGHGSMPWRMRFSPDGTRLVTCADDGTARLWDVESGKELATFPGFGAARGEFVAFSPDGKWLATAADHKVSLRRPSDGVELIGWDLGRSLEALERIFAIRFSDDSQSVFAFRLYVSPQPPGMRFFRWDIPASRQTIFRGAHSALDGKLRLDDKNVITWDGTSELALWNVDSGKEVKIIQAAPKGIPSVAFSPIDNMLAVACYDGKVHFWNTARWKKISPDRSYGHRGIELVQFSPDGKYLITADAGGSVAVWDAPQKAADKKRSPVD